MHTENRQPMYDINMEVLCLLPTNPRWAVRAVNICKDLGIGMRELARCMKRLVILGHPVYTLAGDDPLCYISPRRHEHTVERAEWYWKRLYSEVDQPPSPPVDESA